MEDQKFCELGNSKCTEADHWVVEVELLESDAVEVKVLDLCDKVDVKEHLKDCTDKVGVMYLLDPVEALVGDGHLN